MDYQNKSISVSAVVSNPTAVSRGPHRLPGDPRPLHPSFNPPHSPDHPHAKLIETKTVYDTIIAELRTGNFFETACALAGVVAGVARKWLTMGAKDVEAGQNTLFAKFFMDVTNARAVAESGIVARLNKYRDPRADMFLLGQMFPDRWQKRNRTELTGKDGGPIQSENLSVEEFKARADSRLNGAMLAAMQANEDDDYETAEPIDTDFQALG